MNSPRILPTAQTPTAAERRATAEALVKRTKQLCVAPPVAFQVFGLLRSPDYSCEALVALVRLDPDLTAQLLRMCNSVVFRGREVSSLQEAVLRIGNGAIAEKAMSITVGRILVERKTDYCPDPNALWRHSVLCALACRYLTAHCARVSWDPDLGFTAGLLHDIGKMVINSAPDEDTKQIVALANFMAKLTHTEDGDDAGDAEAIPSSAYQKGQKWADAEIEVLGADHAEIGGLILERWNIPAPIVQAVRFHHAPELDSLGLANLVYVANACAKVNEGSKAWADFEAALDPEVLKQLRLSLPELKKCWADVLHDMDEIERFMWT